jgi:CxxC motif-containing protein (DUF1111 family)
MTARLWGLRFRTRFMHDGRATDLTQAILSHGGEATSARNAFSALDDSQRRMLLAFLYSL